ncbi:MAG: hypothetical protein V1792_11835 [Pseudomonadota bacterium]
MQSEPAYQHAIKYRYIKADPGNGISSIEDAHGDLVKVDRGFWNRLRLDSSERIGHIEAGLGRLIRV